MISVEFQNTLGQCDFKHVLAGFSFHFRSGQSPSGAAARFQPAMCPLIQLCSVNVGHCFYL